jgi:N-acyl-D-amino-acid deacylase
MKNLLVILSLIILLTSCLSKQKFDVIIKNGTIVDGTGKDRFIADIGIKGDSICSIGKLNEKDAVKIVEARGLIVAPGFINMLSWANESLIADGRSQSDIRQGVTLEVMGEGESMGPVNNRMKRDMKDNEGDVKYEITWNTLGEYLEFLEKKGVSTNVASFIGAATPRIYMLAYKNRKPDKNELDSMKLLVRQAMEEGAMGVSSALEYVPACFASTEELIALCSEAAKYNGMYISHIRDEGDDILKSLDELITVAKEAEIRAEVYHLKQVGVSNWNKYDDVVRKIDSARKNGISITADMYNYIASSTGLDIIMPAWVQEGGMDEWIIRISDPVIRRKIYNDIHKAILNKTGSPDKVLLIGFNNDSLKYLTGKTLAQIASIRKKSPEETAMDLVIQDRSRAGVVYFSMLEENVKKQIALPWVSFCSDAGSYAPEGVFLRSSTHPRAYGNFARLLGKYVREEKTISLEEAVRKLSGLPATNLKLKRRGFIKTGNYADIAIFDASKITDHATFENPQQYATGMVHVLVNGIQVLKDGEHTGATPGRFVKGPGWNQR